MNQTMQITETPWVPDDTFGTRLRWLRSALGHRQGLRKPMPVDQIAALCGFGPASWTNWENGTMPRGMHEIVAKIVEATGVDREWLMWGDRARGVRTGRYRPAGGGTRPRGRARGRMDWPDPQRDLAA